MNIGIIGGGATGLLLSSYLSEEHTVTIYVRREAQRSKLARNGLKLTNCSGRIQLHALLSENLQEEDCFIVCVKQSNVTSIIPLLGNISSHTPLIFLQNGKGHLDEIKLLQQPTMLGELEQGAIKLKYKRVEQNLKRGVTLSDE